MNETDFYNYFLGLIERSGAPTDEEWAKIVEKVKSVRPKVNFIFDGVYQNENQNEFLRYFT